MFRFQTQTARDAQAASASEGGLKAKSEAEVLPRDPTVLGFTISRDIAR
jgi:hypothetical protein